MLTRWRFGFAILIAALFAGCWRCDAATIDITPLNSNEQALVTVTGRFENSDIEQFRTKTSLLSKAIVAFASGGGSLQAGIEIGTTLRLKGFVSYVPDGVQCASACALAWLGGAKRLMGPSAQVGFHAAYVVKDGVTSETATGNALVGAYLNRIGLPDRAVIYITQAAPQEMTWLSIGDAEKLGIDVELFSPDTAKQEPQPASPVPSNPSVALPAKPNPAKVYDGRFSRTDCGSINDRSTGLDWIVGPDVDVGWREAFLWAQALHSCGKSWRLPSSAELASLFDRDRTAGVGYFTSGRRWPAHIDPIFEAIGEGSWVWTDTERPPGKAIAMNFNQGIDVRIDENENAFSGTVRAFAVSRIIAAATRDSHAAEDVVRRFYSALGAGNGDEASSLIVPEKRFGALSAASITNYYSTLPEPLRLTLLEPAGGGDFVARYQFRSAQLHCDGSAIVSTVARGEDIFIGRIRALNGC